MREVFGKHRGKVTSNADPQKLGRLEVVVPSVLGAQAKVWALPSVPYAGPGVGLVALPPRDANIWVEFEDGDTDHPIWTGCYWTRDDHCPVSPEGPDVKVLKLKGLTITFRESGREGGVTLEVGSPIVQTPVKLVLGAQGVELKGGSGSIKLTQAGVSVNDGALEVS